MPEGLTEEQKEHVLHACRSGLFDLIREEPKLMVLDLELLTKVYLAGVVAGVEAFDRVLNVGLRDWPS